MIFTQKTFVIYEHRSDGWWFSEDFGRSWQKGAR